MTVHSPTRHGRPLVMAALVAAIHVLGKRNGAKTWIPGTSPGMTAEGVRTGDRLEMSKSGQAGAASRRESPRFSDRGRREKRTGSMTSSKREPIGLSRTVLLGGLRSHQARRASRRRARVKPPHGTVPRPVTGDASRARPSSGRDGRNIVLIPSAVKNKGRTLSTGTALSSSALRLIPLSASSRPAPSSPALSRGSMSLHRCGSARRGWPDQSPDQVRGRP